MKQETDVIKLAKLKNGADFDKWVDNVPSEVADIEKIRRITQKIPYSMAKETKANE